MARMTGPTRATGRRRNVTDRTPDSDASALDALDRRTYLQAIGTAVVGSAVILLGSLHVYLVHRIHELNLNKINELMTRDELTRLFNLRAGQEALQREMERAERYQEAFAVLSIDLDNFKTVNDTLGHSAGDDLLVKVADTLKASSRRTDIPVRVGGDEFLMILPNTGIGGAVVLASRLIEHIRKLSVQEGEEVENQIPISASIGTAAFPDHGTDGEKLLQKVDKALYKAKNNGGSQYSLPQE